MEEIVAIACDLCGRSVTAESPIPFDNQSKPDSVYVTHCQHIFHKSCIYTRITTSVTPDPVKEQSIQCPHPNCGKDITKQQCYKADVTRIIINVPSNTEIASAEVQNLQARIAELEATLSVRQDEAEDILSKSQSFENQLEEAQAQIKALSIQLNTTNAKYESLRKTNISTLFAKSTPTAAPQLNLQPTAQVAPIQPIPNVIPPAATVNQLMVQQPSQGFVEPQLPPPPPVHQGPSLNEPKTAKHNKPSKNAVGGILAPTVPVGTGIPLKNAGRGATNRTQHVANHPHPGTAATKGTTTTDTTKTDKTTTTTATTKTGTMMTYATAATTTTHAAPAEDAAAAAATTKFKIPLIEQGTAQTAPFMQHSSPLSPHWTNQPQPSTSSYGQQSIGNSANTGSGVSQVTNQNNAVPSSANVQNRAETSTSQNAAGIGSNANNEAAGQQAGPSADEKKKKKRNKPTPWSNTTANRATFDSRYPKITTAVLHPFYPTNAYPLHFALCGRRIADQKTVMALFAYDYLLLGDIHAVGLWDAITYDKPYKDNFDPKLYRRDMTIANLARNLNEMTELPANLMISIGTYDIFLRMPRDLFREGFQHLANVLIAKQVRRVIILPPVPSLQLDLVTYETLIPEFSRGWGSGLFAYLLAANWLENLDEELPTRDQLGPCYQREAYLTVAQNIDNAIIPAAVLTHRESTAESKHDAKQGHAPQSKVKAPPKPGKSVQQSAAVRSIPQPTTPQTLATPGPSNSMVMQYLIVNPQTQQATAVYSGSKAVGTPPYPNKLTGSSTTTIFHPNDPRGANRKTAAPTAVTISPHSGLHLASVGFSDDETKPLDEKVVLECAGVMTHHQTAIKSSKMREQEKLAANAATRETLQQKMEWKKEDDDKKASPFSLKKELAKKPPVHPSVDHKNIRSRSSSASNRHRSPSVKTRTERKTRSGDEATDSNSGKSLKPKYIGQMVPSDDELSKKIRQQLETMFGKPDDAPSTHSDSVGSTSESDVPRAGSRKSRSSVKAKLATKPKTQITQRPKTKRVNAAIRPRDSDDKKDSKNWLPCTFTLKSSLIPNETRKKTATTTEQHSTEVIASNQPIIASPNVDNAENVATENSPQSIDLAANPPIEQELPRGAQPIEQRVVTTESVTIETNQNSITLHSVETDESIELQQVLTTESSTEFIENNESVELNSINQDDLFNPESAANNGTDESNSVTQGDHQNPRNAVTYRLYDLIGETPSGDLEFQQPVTPRTEANLLGEEESQMEDSAIEPKPVEGNDEEEDDDL